MAQKFVSKIFGTRSRVENVLAWSAALGVTYMWYKWEATSSAPKGAQAFTAGDSDSWNQKVRAANPAEFTAEVAKETARANAASAKAAKASEKGAAAAAAGSQADATSA